MSIATGFGQVLPPPDRVTALSAGSNWQDMTNAADRLINQIVAVSINSNNAVQVLVSSTAPANSQVGIYAGRFEAFCFSKPAGYRVYVRVTGNNPAGSIAAWDYQ